MTEPVAPATAADAPAETVAHVEAKAVALLLLMAALTVAFLLYVMYARGAFEVTQRLVLVSDDSEGVIPGMDMTFAGFPIGRVQRVELGPDGKARILVDVPRKDAKWLKTSSVFTLERSMVGETRIRAFTGMLEDPPLPEDAVRTVLRGDTSAEIPRVVASARALLENLDTMTRSDSAINNSLANLEAMTGRFAGKYGLLGGALGSDAEAQKLIVTLDRVNGLIGNADGLIGNADRRLFGKKGLVDDSQAAVIQMNVVLKDASNTLKKLDAVLAEAQEVGANAKVATKDLGALRAEVDASLRKVTRMIDEINRKWPFARTPEIKLP